MKFDKVVIIRSKTRLEQLIERFNTKAQAKFYIERSGSEFGFYELEHNRFYEALQQLTAAVSIFDSYKILDRKFVHSYIFSDKDLILVLGQDGLVANSAKYVLGRPIVAINPDPETYDGILLPYTVEKFKNQIQDIKKGKFNVQKITMAEAKFNDGQSLLAFNDFFIGTKSHVSARYKIRFNNKEETQSSSGIIVSTGAGSTGWMSSIFNMVNGINHFHKGSFQEVHHNVQWNTDQLIFAVREPFLSQTTSVSLCFGEIAAGHDLEIESQMPDNGIVFSDGIEADAIRFTTGMSVKIGIAHQAANLIV
ncbi:MAG: sugar kinase [Crocinitomix sp.]|nr:sugar kinase [Crocinitomix sp.]